VERLAERPGHVTASERTASLLRIVARLMQARSGRPAEDTEALLRSAAYSASRLNVEMMQALLEHANAAHGSEEAALAASLVGRMTPPAVATFVARNVGAEHGATARLAQAFEALVTGDEQRDAVLEAAFEEAQRSALGREAGFDELWQRAAGMLRSYSDKAFVSDSYGRELSHARTQATDVERLSDDPPERVQAWVATVAPAVVEALDHQLLLDLLRIEQDPLQWGLVAGTAATEVERVMMRGDAAAARRLVEPLVAEYGSAGRLGHRSAAGRILEQLVGGRFIGHVVAQLRTSDDDAATALRDLCHLIGPVVIRPLAEALAAEQNHRPLLRLREVLLGFGAAGRQSVEQLKLSPNPAVRRTAIELLRIFGGQEALPELASMLDDADPQVQREAIRAIVLIGSNEAYAVLERALLTAGAVARDTILQQLLALHDRKAVPLLCYVLRHTTPRGKLVDVHVAILDELGGLGPHPASTSILEEVLHRGEWWAPRRTAKLREAAAVALRRLGSPEARAVLLSASERGTRGVRKLARAQGAMIRPAPLERAR
jgi:hypothetical protein